MSDLHAIKEEFWEEFRWLVRWTLDRVQVSEEDDLRYQIGDMTSCFHPGIPERGEKREEHHVECYCESCERRRNNQAMRDDL